MLIWFLVFREGVGRELRQAQIHKACVFVRHRSSVPNTFPNSESYATLDDRRPSFADDPRTFPVGLQEVILLCVRRAKHAIGSLDLEDNAGFLLEAKYLSFQGVDGGVKRRQQ